jgi:hypothetical protein
MNCRPSKCSSESSLVLSDHPQYRHGASDRLVLRAALHNWPPVSSVVLKQIAPCRLSSPSVRPVTTCRRSRRFRGEPQRIAGDSWGIPSDSRLTTPCRGLVTFLRSLPGDPRPIRGDRRPFVTDPQWMSNDPSRWGSAQSNPRGSSDCEH